MDELPLRPLLDEPPCGPGIRQALATFSLSALLAAGTVLTLPAKMSCKGASRSAQLKRAAVRAQLLAAERACAESPGSMPSR
jgi:hypothetical protein